MMASLSDYSHCFFCLQEQDPKIARELVTRNPKRIEDIQPLIHYISTNGTENFNFNGTSPNDLDLDRTSLALPSMCISCYDALADLQRLHRCLVDIQLLIQSQSGRIQNIVNLKSSSYHSQSSPSPTTTTTSRTSRSSTKNSLHVNLRNSARQKYLAHLEKMKAPADVIFGVRRLLQSESKQESEFEGGGEAAQTQQLAVANPKSTILKTRTRRNVEAEAEAGNDDIPIVYFEPGDTVKIENEMEAIEENENDEFIRVTLIEATNAPGTTATDSNEPDLGDPLRDSESDSGSEYVPSDTDEVDYDHELDPEEETEMEKKYEHGSSKRRKMENEDDDEEDEDDGLTQNCDDDFQKCDVCRTMVTKGAMGRHMKLIHSLEVSNGARSNLIECKLCSEDETRPEETWFSIDHEFYMSHLKKAHSRREAKPCHICGSRFTTLKKLTNHYLQVHKEGIEFKCELCPKSFYVKDSLLQHMHLCHRHPESLPCDLCVRDNGDIPKSYYRSQELLDSHMKVYHREDRFKCERCPVHFRCKFDLRKHEKESHSKEPFICHQCSEEFLSQLDFTKHQHFHRDEVVRRAREAKLKKRQVSCKTCAKKFTTAALRYHLKTAHGTDKFTCENCGKSFRTLDGLRVHMKVHPPEGQERPRPFVCDVCGKAFTLQRILDSHYLRHTGERPYECQLCESRFRQRAALRTHMKQHEKAVFKRKRTHDNKID